MNKNVENIKKELPTKVELKTLTIKEKICAHCMLKETCGDLPGLCMLLYYALIAVVIVGLSYFLITMKL